MANNLGVQSAALAGLLVLATPVPVTAQSDAGPGRIDCGTASLDSHQLICGDTALNAQAIVLSLAYDRLLALAAADQRVSLIQTEVDFVIRRDGCRTSSCLGLVFDGRLEELAQLAGPSNGSRSASQGPGRQADVRGDASPQSTAPSSNTATASDPAEGIEPPPQQAGFSSAIVPPEPLGDPASWITAADYPAGQLTNGEAGLTRYQLRVGANGLPVQCFSIASSGHWQLDTRVCNRIMSRARFTPGRDAAGNPAEGLYEGSHNWLAPQ